MNALSAIRRLSTLLLPLVVFLGATPAFATLEWPQEINAPEGTIVVYQPQPESLAGNVLSGRAAISLELKNQSEPIFGAMWFSAKIDTDRDADTAIVRDVRVERVTWPDSKDAEEQRFTAIVEAAIPATGFEISMERLSASLATAEVVQKSLEDLNTDPPKIIFREELAVLLLFDGKPRLSEIEGSPYERVTNVPMAVACKKGGKPCWLSSGTFWYESNDPLGPWAPTASPPADLASMLPEPDATEGSPSSPPAIVVATEPTELIATDGKPNWTSLAGGELLYVQNTESPWLRELATGNMYLLLSGRWYRSKSAEGPWTFVKPDELPASFAAIPPASDIGGLRTSVAGTPEADEAVRDAAIPQTAAIKRSEASLTVADGRIRRQAEIREDQGHRGFLRGQHRRPGARNRRALLCGGQRRLVYCSGSDRTLGGGGRRARGQDCPDPALGARVQHHPRTCLRLDSRCRLRRLHAGLHVVLSVLRRAGIRHRLVLPSLLRTLLLPAPAHLGFQRRLQPLDRLEFRPQLEQRLFQHGRKLGRWIRRRLLSGPLLRRLVWRRLPRTGRDQHR